MIHVAFMHAKAVPSCKAQDRPQLYQTPAACLRLTVAKLQSLVLAKGFDFGKPNFSKTEKSFTQ